ncbi:MAG: aspartate/glutamate racemase family protein, partial [Spirochaetales bacterium]|nr:aspartate/glutamate racemase family protein [Spirochaetales bacterium]
KELLDHEGIETIEIPEELQNRLHLDIYHKKWGIKALSSANDRVKKDMEGFAEMLIEKGAEGIIMGCTEIPLAFSLDSFLGVPLIDPMTALARGLIREADPEKLRPLSFTLQS